MAKNLNPSQLDFAQLAKRCFDDSNDSVRIVLGDSAGIAIILSATEDSVTNYPNSSSSKASVTSSSTGTILAALDVSGMKSFALYTNTTSTLTGAQVCTLQISPSATDDVWIDTTTTVTPSTTSGTVVVSTTNTSAVAKRARVKIAAAISSGTFDLYLVCQGV